MCFLYPVGIPLMFAALMRRERQATVAKVHLQSVPSCACVHSR
jgi:hypothetical protein